MGSVLVVLGGIFAVYGLAMAVLYPSGGFFALWLVMAAGLFGVAWARHTGAWAAAAAWVRAAVCGAALAVAVGVGAGCWLIFSAQATPAPAGLDYLIVLGAGLNPDGSPSETLRYRLDAACEYLEENPETRCVVTGGQGGDEVRTEASAMAEYLIDQGISEGRILREEQATSTVENLELSHELLEAAGEGDASLAVVTTDFHLYRALRIAERQGLGRLAGISAPSNPFYQPQNVLRECLVLAKDALLGNI